MGIYAILTILQKLDNRVHKKIKVLELYVELQNTVTVSTFLQQIRELDLKLESVQFEPEGGFEAETRAVLMTLKAKKATDHKMLRAKIRQIEGVVHLEEL